PPFPYTTLFRSHRCQRNQPILPTGVELDDANHATRSIYPCQRLTPQSSEKKTAHSSYSSTPTTNPNPAAAATHQKQDQSPTNHGHHHQTRPHTYTGTRSSTQSIYCR